MESLTSFKLKEKKWIQGFWNVSGATFLLDNFRTNEANNHTLKTLIFSVKHSLKYFLTATSGTPNFPEFVGVATLDEVQIGYCDNLEGEAQLKQNWMKKLINKTPKHLKFYSEKCSRNHLLFKANMDDFKQRLNRTEGKVKNVMSKIIQKKACFWGACFEKDMFK